VKGRRRGVGRPPYRPGPPRDFTGSRIFRRRSSAARPPVRAKPSVPSITVIAHGHDAVLHRGKSTSFTHGVACLSRPRPIPSESTRAARAYRTRRLYASVWSLGRSDERRLSSQVARRFPGDRRRYLFPRVRFPSDTGRQRRVAANLTFRNDSGRQRTAYRRSRPRYKRCARTYRPTRVIIINIITTIVIIIITPPIVIKRASTCASRCRLTRRNRQPTYPSSPTRAPGPCR